MEKLKINDRVKQDIDYRKRTSEAREKLAKEMIENNVRIYEKPIRKYKLSEFNQWSKDNCRNFDSGLDRLFVKGGEFEFSTPSELFQASCVRSWNIILFNDVNYYMNLQRWMRIKDLERISELENELEIKRTCGVPLPLENNELELKKEILVEKESLITELLRNNGQLLKKFNELKEQKEQSTEKKSENPPIIENKTLYHKCDFWCAKCGFEVILNQTGILNRNEDCYYCLQCKEVKMREFIPNDKKDLEIESLKEKLSIFEARESLNQSLRSIKLGENIFESELGSISSHSENGYSLIEEQI